MKKLLQPVFLLLIFLFLPISNLCMAVSDKDSDVLSFDEHLSVWKKQASSKKGGEAYKVFSDSLSWYNLFKTTLESWGDLGSRQGIEAGSVQVVKTLAKEEVWDSNTIPMVLSEQQRVDALVYCVSYHVTSRVLYPQSYSYEKQSTYILKKYLDGRVNKQFVPSKDLMKILDKCEVVFKRDIDRINVLVEDAHRAHLEREAALKAAAELLAKKEKEQPQKLIKEEKPRKVLDQEDRSGYEFSGWLLYIVEFIAFMLVAGIILLPVLRRDEQMAQEEEREKKRNAIGLLKNRLIAKYHDDRIVSKIAAHEYWQGQTQEQLLDSLGKPDDIDSYVMKSEMKETWKYKLKAKKGYSLLIFLDNGMVVGWETL